MPQKKARKPAGASRRRLGRGLESLISSPVVVDVPSVREHQSKPKRESIEEPAGSTEEAPITVMIKLDQIHRNVRQPRQEFDEDSLRSLADSIKAEGLMQPIMVRPKRSGEYEIVAGERRWRAARMIDLTAIPCVVRNIDDRTAAKWSLVENLQREDLNPIERAEAFHSLITDFQFTHQEIAERVGLDRSSVSNHLRLIELDDDTKEMVRNGRITMGHGRALLAIANLQDRKSLARKAVKQEWSVRQIEQRIRSRISQSAASKGDSKNEGRAHLQDLQRSLGEHLGTKVQIQPGRKKGQGKLVISFYDLDQFEGLMRRLDFTCE